MIPDCGWRVAKIRRGAALLLCVSLGALAGCGGRKGAGGPAQTEPLVEDMSWGAVQMTVTAEPGKVDLGSDLVLSIRLTAPPEMDVSLPPLDDRAAGFAVAGSFDDEPVEDGGSVTRVRHVRLSPVVADEYRLKPFAVSYVDRRARPPQSGWFPTRPIVFDVQKLVKGVPGSKIEERLEPVWIYPPFKTVALWVGLVLACMTGVILAWKLLRRVRRHVELMRMSPRERALKELQMLFAKDLPGQHKVKDFYLELTMIVRRYIERQHQVRAPEQTTGEFLRAVVDHPEFNPAVVGKLRAFLEAADLVKFADFHPSAGAVENAGATARDYVRTDTTGTATTEAGTC